MTTLETTPLPAPHAMPSPALAAAAPDTPLQTSIACAGELLPQQRRRLRTPAPASRRPTVWRHCSMQGRQL